MTDSKIERGRISAFPARVHVVLASHAPVGVVIRRGPSRTVATLLWDRRDDSFQMGQWFKGRIYERRCDLSPDGKFFLYFAMNGHWQTETRGSWSAISRAPYLKALALFPKGDCWQGGGLWTGKNRYWLNGCHDALQDTRLVIRNESYRPQEYFSGECPGVYYPRLLRDGWRLVEWERNRLNRVDIFEKEVKDGWVLRKWAHAEVGAPVGKGCYWDEHELEHSKTGTLLSFPDWEWAEVDGNRLVWTSKGKLFKGVLHKNGLQDQGILKDFNNMTFEHIEAPY